MEAEQVQVGASAPALSRRPQPLAAGSWRLGRERLDAGQRAALVTAAGALAGSRLLVWGAGLTAVLAAGVATHPSNFDPPGLTHGFGSLGDLLVAPADRWDAAWYLSIAHGGYGEHAIGGADGRAAFFPLYPLLMRLTGALGPGLVLGGVLISLLALFVALYLTHRLAALELGGPRAGAGLAGPRRRDDSAAAPRLAVLATALFPMAIFFSAVYSEALYLALSLGAFWLARRERWAAAGAVGGLAAATRSIGLLLVIPLVLIYLYGPRGERGAHAVAPRRASRAGVPGGGPGAWLRRLAPSYAVGPDLLWIALVPAGLGAFLGYLALQGGDPLGPFSVQDVWYRHFAGPLGGVADGAVAAWEGALQLLSGSRSHVYFTASGGDPFITAEHNLVLFAFLLAAVPAVVGIMRRLPLAYGAYVLVALALPLSYPVAPQPLMSLPRFLAALFPLHLWTGAWLADHPRARAPVLALYAIGMAVSTAQFATWHWVA